MWKFVSRLGWNNKGGGDGSGSGSVSPSLGVAPPLTLVIMSAADQLSRPV